jgi:two-component system chemotaxis response regulator CheY
MKPTLIIADDSPEFRAELRRILSPQFDIVAEAADGLETIELCKHYLPALLVMDIAMPRMSGIDAIHSVLKMDTAPAIVVVSGIREEGVVFQALEAGALDYLFKPVDAEALRRALGSFVKKAAA